MLQNRLGHLGPASTIIAVVVGLGVSCDRRMDPLTTEQQGPQLAERARLLTLCGLDDWLRPVEEFTEEEREALDLLVPLDQFNRFTTADLVGDSTTRPAACEKLKPSPPAAPVAAPAGLGLAFLDDDVPLFRKEREVKVAGGLVRFAVLGDVGETKSDDVKIRDAVIDRVRKVCLGTPQEPPKQPCAFGVFLGDNLYPDGLSKHADKRLKDEAALGELIRKFGLPAYVALGNHDWHPFFARQERARWSLKYIAAQTDMFGGAHFYNFLAGPASLWALDTNYLVRVNGSVAVVESDGWLDEFKKPRSGWTIAFGHHAYLSNGSHGNAGSYDDVWKFGWEGEAYQKFLQDHVLNRADLLLSGHDHNLQFYPVVQNGLRTAQVVSGAVAKCKGPGNRENTGNGTSVAPAFEYYGPGFTIVEATTDRLTVEMHRRDTTGWHVWTASKASGGAWSLAPYLGSSHPDCSKWPK